VFYELNNLFKRPTTINVSELYSGYRAPQGKKEHGRVMFQGIQVRFDQLMAEAWDTLLGMDTDDMDTDEERIDEEELWRDAFLDCGGPKEVLKEYKEFCLTMGPKQALKLAYKHYWDTLDKDEQWLLVSGE
jgi:hypothetical protein